MALARWKKHREKPLDPEILAELISNPAIRKGDAISSLQWRDFRSGRVLRWTVLRGDRVDRVILRHPDGRKTKSHGWTWVMDHLRGFLPEERFRTRGPLKGNRGVDSPRALA